MEISENTIESQIAAILCDIRQKGYSSVQPFSIGKVEERMTLFAQVNAITLASDELYMSAKQLQHCMRASKATKGLVVDDADPQNRQEGVQRKAIHQDTIKAGQLVASSIFE